ncbi:MAG: Holliday junction branch migration protein RuvA [Acidobacteria bacterium]|nr:MAG: Holliday junction branch migration protein RuvA [Acidobacteriota bacterium]PYY21463.1 MAG: Holliday junction branch migration protein RuvA [Acidobacteriota bacterium]
MIAHLRGRILEKNPSHVILEAAGVGYEVTISVPSFSGLPAEGAEVSLYIHTHVREDTLALYGFLRREEKQLFERLIGVSGIGPKLAITVLSGIAADALVTALRSNDLTALTRIPGVGKKTAERMVLELRDKLEGLAAAPAPPQTSRMEEDVVSALVNLGYQRTPAEHAVRRALERAGNAASFEQVFRQTMTLMQK